MKEDGFFRNLKHHVKPGAISISVPSLIKHLIPLYILYGRVARVVSII